MSLGVTSGITIIVSGVAPTGRTFTIEATPVNIYSASGNLITDYSGALNVNVSGGTISANVSGNYVNVAASGVGISHYSGALNVNISGGTISANVSGNYVNMAASGVGISHFSGALNVNISGGTISANVSGNVVQIASGFGAISGVQVIISGGAGSPNISGGVTVSGGVQVSGSILNQVRNSGGTITDVGITSGGTTMWMPVGSMSGAIVLISGVVGANVSGGITVSGSLQVSGTVAISGQVIITSGGTIPVGVLSGAMNISGGVTVSGGITVSGSVQVSGTVSAGIISGIAFVNTVSGTTGSGTSLAVANMNYDYSGLKTYPAPTVNSGIPTPMVGIGPTYNTYTLMFSGYITQSGNINSGLSSTGLIGLYNPGPNVVEILSWYMYITVGAANQQQIMGILRTSGTINSGMALTPFPMDMNNPASTVSGWAISGGGSATVALLSSGLTTTNSQDLVAFEYMGGAAATRTTTNPVSTNFLNAQRIIARSGQGVLLKFIDTNVSGLCNAFIYYTEHQ